VEYLLGERLLASGDRGGARAAFRLAIKDGESAQDQYPNDPLARATVLRAYLADVRMQQEAKDLEGAVRVANHALETMSSWKEDSRRAHTVKARVWAAAAALIPASTAEGRQRAKEYYGSAVKEWKAAEAINPLNQEDADLLARTAATLERRK